MWRRWAHLRISFWHLLMNFGKPENPEFWKNEKKLLEISSFYTCVPKTTIIWGTVPQIQNERKFFCHFGTFFALMITWYTVLEIWCVTNVIIMFSFWVTGYFLPFYPSNGPRNENSNKMKKMPEDIIILHNCTKKIMVISYTVPEKWHMTHVIVIFHFRLIWAIFCSFTPSSPPHPPLRPPPQSPYQPKKQISKKSTKKPPKYLDISSFYTCVP